LRYWAIFLAIIIVVTYLFIRSTNKDLDKVQKRTQYFMGGESANNGALKTSQPAKVIQR
jgi:Na+/H+ antiporter NhaC